MAGAALALAACGTQTPAQHDAAGSSAASSAASDGATGTVIPAASESPTASAAPASAAATATPSAAPSQAAGGLQRVAVTTALDDAIAPRNAAGQREVSQEALQELLERTVGGSDAGCDGNLVIAADREVPCGAVMGERTTERQDVWAYPAVLPGGEASVVFAAPGSLSPTAAKALANGSNKIAWLGFGGEYGMEPTSAESLVGDTQRVLDSEQPSARNDWMLTVRSCDGALDMQSFEPVTCHAEAEGSGGALQDIQVLPGMFLQGDAGLIVSATGQADI